MIHYPNFDPVLFAIGPLKIRWYGLMYIFGFLIAWALAKNRAKKPHSQLNINEVDDLVFYGMLGVIIGARFFYMIFYNRQQLIHTPWSLFMTWQGGMSFHGGVIGVACALWWYSRKIQKPFFDITDFAMPLIPLGLCLGRLGNFINGELWGKVTTVPWAMVFPAGGPWPRHPSQLYESFLEGLVLFIILWLFTRSPKPRMAATGLFLLVYGCFRFSLEFFRQPDFQIGYIAFDWLTMGQLLSVPMIITGGLLLLLAYRKISHANLSGVSKIYH